MFRPVVNNLILYYNNEYGGEKMDNIITINNLTFQYGDLLVFDNLNLNIKAGTFTTILGQNASGKITLAKLIAGLVFGNQPIHFEAIPITEKNSNEIHQYISVIFENPDKTFLAKTVKEEIGLPLENLKYSPDVINERVIKMANLLGLNDILKQEPHNLNHEDKQLVSLARALITAPKLLVIDEGFTHLSPKMRDQILKILADLNKNDHLTIINNTDDVEECLYGNHLNILGKHKLMVAGTTKTVLNHPEIFEQAKLDLPFIVALSNKLKFYNLIEETYLDEGKLVEDLWP